MSSKPVEGRSRFKAWIIKQRYELSLCAALIILVIGAYGRLYHSYFATDEWWAFSFAISHRTIAEAILPSGVYAPSANLLIHWLYWTFGLNEQVWAVLTVSAHAATTVLVYLLTRKITQRSSIGFLTALIFAIAPMGSQFVHQFSMFPTSAMSTLFGFLGLLAYSYRRTILAAFLYFIALSFAPYAVPFIVLAALLEIVMIEWKKWWQAITRFLPMVTAFGLYYLVLKLTSLKTGGLKDRPVVLGESLLVHLEHIAQKAYQSIGELVTRPEAAFDPHSMLMTTHIVVAIVLVGIILLLVRKQYLLARTAIIGLLWIPASLSIFSTLNTTALDVTFPSRYLYVSILGLGLVVGSILLGLFDDLKLSKTTSSITLGSILTALACVGAFMLYWKPLDKILTAELQIAKNRKMIMETIATEVPSVGRDAVFCFTSNTGHYGAYAEAIPMPFAHNFGFNLAILYRKNVPKMNEFFIDSSYFVNPAASFYRYTREQSDPNGIGPGIGFATSVQKCEEIHAVHGFIAVDSYYGFAYDGNAGKLINITPAIRKVISGQKAEAKSLYPWMP